MNLYAAAAVTLVLCTLYAIAYYWMDTQDPDHGITPWAVVVGVGIVGAVYFGLIFAWGGLEHALIYIGALGVLFVAAGLPMIIGYYVVRIGRKRRPHIGG